MRPVLTAKEMGEVDRKTAELGIPGIVLMENAGMRVVEMLERRFVPLQEQRVVIICGKGNNGGDGLVVARQLFTRFRLKTLDVVLTANPEELHGDAALNFKMLRACGCPYTRELAAHMSNASVIVDAVLGTGLEGPARGPALDAIRQINGSFPLAKVVAVDIPSGLPHTNGEFVRADYTVTFTALKVTHALSPDCNLMGRIELCAIGSPSNLYNGSRLAEVEPADFAHLLAPRPLNSNKGMYGHILVVAGSRGKSGAAYMAGIAALRAGTGLVTVATAKSALDLVAVRAPELMTDPLEETATGGITDQQISLGKKTLLAMGPGLGSEESTIKLVRRLFQEIQAPMVVDADALNALAGSDWHGGSHLRVLTPHPGEMGSLTGKTVSDVQKDRVETARELATNRHVIVVLKGDRTLIAFPDGRVWINPTGSPSMATGGSGDILTGIVAGFLAQFPKEPELAIAAAVYLHGLAGQFGAVELTEQAFLAMDILTYLPKAIQACANVHH